MNLKIWCLFMAVSLTFIYIGLAGSRPFGEYLDRMLRKRLPQPPALLSGPPPLLSGPPANESFTFTFGKHFSNLGIPTPPKLIRISNLNRTAFYPPGKAGPSRSGEAASSQYGGAALYQPGEAGSSQSGEAASSQSGEAGSSQSGPPLKCWSCQMDFIHQLLLRRHMKDKHGVKLPLKCEICGKEFKFETKLSVHMKSEHGDPNFLKCPVCCQCFNDINNFIQHMNIHPSQVVEPEIRTGPLAALAELWDVKIATGFRCPSCPQKCRTIVILRRHGNRAHNLTIKPNEVPAPCGHQCFYCLERTFKTVQQFQQHFRDRHLLNGSCPVCPSGPKYNPYGDDFNKHIDGHQEFYGRSHRPGVGGQSDRDSSLEYDRRYTSSERRIGSPKQGLSHSITEQMLRLTNPEHDEPRALAERTLNHKVQILADTFTKGRVTGTDKEFPTRAVKRGGGKLLNAIGKVSLQLKKFKQEKLPLPRRFDQRG